MKTFAYRGYRRDAARTRGLIEALDPKEARERLAARGILAEEIVPAQQHATPSGRVRAFGLAERASIYRELGALLRAGVPVVASLNLLIDSHGASRTTSVLAGLRDALRDGADFAGALAPLAREVTPFEIALIQTGQRTGQLGLVLEELAGYLEEQHRLRASVQSALLYPLLVVGLAIAIGSVMLFAVLPRLAGLFAETGVALPFVTRVLVWLGQDGRWPTTVGLALVLVVLIASWRRCRRPEARVSVEHVLARIPGIATGYRLVVNIRFVRALVILLRGGVPLVEGLPMAGAASGSHWLAEEIRKGNESVRQGRAVASMLADSPWIGSMVPPWYKAGEASGDLPGLLDQAARRFQSQWEVLLQRFVRLIEPVLILIVGGFVLLVALAILLPVLSLNQTAF